MKHPVLLTSLLWAIAVSAQPANQQDSTPSSGSAQGANTGRPIVGGPSGGAVASAAFIDAAAFSGADMCAKIHNAYAANPSSTIDARGFTGNQPACSAANATTMIPPGTTGPLLLAPTLHLIVDGPPSGHYTDGNGAGVGTPAIVIPNESRGIYGGHGTGGSTASTIISLCAGNNRPAGRGCTTPFPLRSFAITNTRVEGNVMTVTMKGSNLVSGENIYAGACCKAGNEWAQLWGSSTINNRGMYQILTETDGVNGQITVRVPSGTANCSSSCGTLYLGTPLIGFGPPKGVSYTPWGVPNKSSFGAKLHEVQLNMQFYPGAIGVQNIYAQELSDVRDIRMINVVFSGFYVGTYNAQNSGPYAHSWVLGGNSPNCDYGTTGFILSDTFTHGIKDTTFDFRSDVDCGGQPLAAIYVDGVKTNAIRDSHCENFTTCVSVGASNSVQGLLIEDFVGPPGVCRGTSVVHIANFSGTKTSDVELIGIRRNGDPDTVQDDINNITDTDEILGFYAMDLNDNANGLLSSGAIKNQFGSGLVTSTLSTVSNCAVNSVSPAACGSAASGAFVVPAKTTTYTVNTTAVTTHSRIVLTPMSFAGDLPGSPACVAPAVTSAVTISAISNGVSFSFALPSTSGQTCWQYHIWN